MTRLAIANHEAPPCGICDRGRVAGLLNMLEDASQRIRYKVPAQWRGTMNTNTVSSHSSR